MITSHETRKGSTRVAQYVPHNHLRPGHDIAANAATAASFAEDVMMVAAAASDYHVKSAANWAEAAAPAN